MSDDQAAATKRDLAALEERLIEKMRDMQTEMLRAFHGWARPAEVRTRSHEQRLALDEERLALLEERVSEIERGRKLN